MTHPINSFRARLHAAQNGDHYDMFFDEMNTYGGIWQRKPDAHIEITVHGVTAFGSTDETAIKNWIASADFHPAAIKNPQPGVQ